MDYKLLAFLIVEERPSNYPARFTALSILDRTSCKIKYRIFHPSIYNFSTSRFVDDNEVSQHNLRHLHRLVFSLQIFRAIRLLSFTPKTFPPSPFLVLHHLEQSHAAGSLPVMSLGSIVPNSSVKSSQICFFLYQYFLEFSCTRWRLFINRHFLSQETKNVQKICK